MKFYFILNKFLFLLLIMWLWNTRIWKKKKEKKCDVFILGDWWARCHGNTWRKNKRSGNVVIFSL